MLEYIKTILLKVSFDDMLLEKELKKGLKALEPEEALQLEQWCHSHFRSHQRVLHSVFAEAQELLV